MEDKYNELLLRCAQHKDRRAFRVLYESCSPRLYSLAVRLLNSEGLAEEVLQESFLKIWNSSTYVSTDQYQRSNHHQLRVSIS